MEDLSSAPSGSPWGGASVSMLCSPVTQQCTCVGQKVANKVSFCDFREIKWKWYKFGNSINFCSSTYMVHCAAEHLP